jgi:hypothetical protein
MRSPASDRYQKDPQFKTLVDLIRCELEQSHFTPTELREAVMLAACLYEYQHVRPVIFSENVLRTMPGMREHFEWLVNQDAIKPPFPR